ncbi:isoprenylcysteine carboxylmethyltransferase family protein [Haemophilus influenzae]|uniref:methyltransferase family protein n=1 Tax=Haemophilus influenzae TaxID=727 RepID=UPI000E584091|nr:isoprenylcysteine carboxylmethyltransferase family protein [Haemophilus influenzae]
MLFIPPPLLCLFIAIAMYFLPKIASYSVHFSVIVFVISLSFLIALSSVIQFIICETSINPRDFKGSTKLVSTGIFRFSRNPMYLSLLLMLIAWVLWLGNSLAWLGIIVFVLAINQFQIAKEEAYLENKFGDEYRHYKQKVRRWI